MSDPKAAGAAPGRAGGSTPARRPLHVAVAFGATTGIYALSLLAVTRLQIATDRVVIAAREPASRAIELLGDHHDRLAADLDVARTAYAQGADGFNALTARLPALSVSLDHLDATLAAIEAELQSMPGSFAVPGRPPRVGSGSGGGGTGPGVVPAAPPPAPAPPPTQGNTGASGG